jgi:hypothetical protein
VAAGRGLPTLVMGGGEGGGGANSNDSKIATFSYFYAVTVRKQHSILLMCGNKLLIIIFVMIKIHVLLRRLFMKHSC